ncbi:MAG: hypothetical protein FJ148_12080 [Deltaproteobacteria bacterium]|nr:hypothetical protein [Deltaproteobacteria bacterium]
MRALQGIRVIEVAEWFFMPACGAVLADWGADVVKVEHPTRGDPLRGLLTGGMLPGGAGVNYMVEHANRGKHRARALPEPGPRDRAHRRDLSPARPRRVGRAPDRERVRVGADADAGRGRTRPAGRGERLPGAGRAPGARGLPHGGEPGAARWPDRRHLAGGPRAGPGYRGRSARRRLRLGGHRPAQGRGRHRLTGACRSRGAWWHCAGHPVTKRQSAGSPAAHAALGRRAPGRADEPARRRRHPVRVRLLSRGPLRRRRRQRQHQHLLLRPWHRSLPERGGVRSLRRGTERAAAAPGQVLPALNGPVADANRAASDRRHRLAGRRRHRAAAGARRGSGLHRRSLRTHVRRPR